MCKKWRIVHTYITGFSTDIYIKHHSLLSLKGRDVDHFPKLIWLHWMKLSKTDRAHLVDYVYMYFSYCKIYIYVIRIYSCIKSKYPCSNNGTRRWWHPPLNKWLPKLTALVLKIWIFSGLCRIKEDYRCNTHISLPMFDEFTTLTKLEHRIAH